MKIKIIVFDKEHTFDLKEWCGIAEQDIQQHLLDHSELLAYVGVLKSNKIYECNMLQQKLKEVSASVYINYKNTGRKYSEKQLDNIVTINSEVREATNLYHLNLRFQYILENLFSALKDKKDMLIQVSSNAKIDKKIATNWEKRLSALEAQINSLLEVRNE